MSIKTTISTAGRNLHTLLMTARDDHGRVETTEAEPYSFRFTGTDERFVCYDIKKNATRIMHLARIIRVEETSNSFSPRWPVEV